MIQQYKLHAVGGLHIIIALSSSNLGKRLLELKYKIEPGECIDTSSLFLTRFTVLGERCSPKKKKDAE